MKKDLSRHCICSYCEYISIMGYFKRVDKRRKKNKEARRQRKKQR